MSRIGKKPIAIPAGVKVPMKTATLETSKGTIHLNLFDTTAPKTVANFVDLAKKGFYDGPTPSPAAPTIQNPPPTPRQSRSPAAAHRHRFDHTEACRPAQCPRPGGQLAVR